MEKNGQEREETFPGFLDTGAQSTVIPTPVGEVLAGGLRLDWEELEMQTLMGLR